MLSYLRVRSASAEERDEMESLLSAKPAPAAVRAADPAAPWWWSGEEDAATEAALAMAAYRQVTR